MSLLRKKVCKHCSGINELINDFKGDYIENLHKLNSLEKQGILELYAGDCPVEDANIHYEKEDRYTINHYFKCKECGIFFFIGFCCRGGFVYKEEIDIKKINFNAIFEGKDKLGTYFK